VLSVDDVMQESYIDAFLDVGRFDPRGEGSFRAWLTTLANRNLLDALRMLEAEKRGRNHRQVRPVTSDGSLVNLYDQLGGGNSTPSHHAARTEATQKLQRAIEQLPPTYRKVVEMYDLEGRPVEEVAAALDRSAGAVFMLRSRAHRQMSTIMGTPSQYLTGAR
jgi:RNA polymerase sigma-70 factor (ECF subfamily)